jgi:hypothetical protein
MEAKEKKQLEEIYEVLNDLPTGLHIDKNETILSAYTRAIELLEQYKITVSNVLNDLESLTN